MPGARHRRQCMVGAHSNRARRRSNAGEDKSIYNSADKSPEAEYTLEDTHGQMHGRKSPRCAITTWPPGLWSHPANHNTVVAAAMSAAATTNTSLDNSIVTQELTFQKVRILNRYHYNTYDTHENTIIQELFKLSLISVN